MERTEFERLWTLGVAKEGRPYELARDAVIKEGAAMVPALKQHVAISSDWRTTLTAEAWLSWIQSADIYRELRLRMTGTPKNPLAMRPVGGSESSGIRAYKIAALGTIAVPFIVEILVKTHNVDEDAQQSLFVALGLIKDKRTVQPLLFLASDDSRKSNRVSAVAALGRIGERNAVASLIAMISHEGGDPDLVAAAAVALGQIRDSAALPVLLEVFLNSNNPVPVRQQAVLAIGGIGDERAAAPLADQLGKEESSELVQQLIGTLESIGDRNTLSILQELSKHHSDPLVRERAEEAVHAISNRLRLK